ncbi:hypothetical protein C0991_007827, partial [Blastosporella zonata]
MGKGRALKGAAKSRNASSVLERAMIARMRKEFALIASDKSLWARELNGGLPNSMVMSKGRDLDLSKKRSVFSSYTVACMEVQIEGALSEICLQREDTEETMIGKYESSEDVEPISKMVTRTSS